KGVGLPNINGGGNRSDDVRSAASELALLLKSRKEEEIKPPERSEVGQKVSAQVAYVYTNG
ncbi:MAG: hypothetical protein PHX43_00130, partial [Alphaproteobacteria bacterium]|nr:hypothetical protein [Alphaproteobacteria bacterium]